MAAMGAVILVLFAAMGNVDRLDAAYDYRARAYDPSLGRFLQRDPIGIWGDGINFGNGYAYVGEDPVNDTDPSGLSPKKCNVYILWGHGDKVAAAAEKKDTVKIYDEKGDCCWAQGVLGCQAPQPTVCPIGGNFPDVSAGNIGLSDSNDDEKGAASRVGNGGRNPDPEVVTNARARSAEGFFILLWAAWNSGIERANSIASSLKCCCVDGVTVHFDCADPSTRNSTDLNERFNVLLKEAYKFAPKYMPPKQMKKSSSSKKSAKKKEESDDSARFFCGKTQKIDPSEEVKKCKKKS